MGNGPVLLAVQSNSHTFTIKPRCSNMQNVVFPEKDVGRMAVDVDPIPLVYFSAIIVPSQMCKFPMLLPLTPR